MVLSMKCCEISKVEYDGSSVSSNNFIIIVLLLFYIEKSFSVWLFHSFVVTLLVNK